MHSLLTFSSPGRLIRTRPITGWSRELIESLVDHTVTCFGNDLMAKGIVVDVDAERGIVHIIDEEASLYSQHVLSVNSRCVDTFRIEIGRERKRLLRIAKTSLAGVHLANVGGTPQ